MRHYPIFLQILLLLACNAGNVDSTSVQENSSISANSSTSRSATVSPNLGTRSDTPICDDNNCEPPIPDGTGDDPPREWPTGTIIIPGTPPIGELPTLPGTLTCTLPAPTYHFGGCDTSSSIPWYRKKIDGDLMLEQYEAHRQTQNLNQRKVEVIVLDSGYEYYIQDSSTLVKSPYADAIPEVDFAMGQIYRDGHGQVSTKIELYADRVEQAARADFVNGTLRNGYADTTDLHGTHVNATVAGCSQNGVAKNIILSSFRFELGNACNPQQDDLVAAIDKVCERASRTQDDFKIINVSIGSLADEVGYDERGLPNKPFRDKLPKWREKGCLVVQASGNDSYIRRYNMSNQLYKSMREKHLEEATVFKRLLAPFYLPRVADNLFPTESVIESKREVELKNALLRVGATGSIGYYSSYSSLGEIKAPGTKLQIFDREISGTSFAAPVVTSLLAEIAATVRTFNSQYWSVLDPSEKIDLSIDILNRSQLAGVPNGLRATSMARAVAENQNLLGQEWSSSEMQSQLCPVRLKEETQSCQSLLEANSTTPLRTSEAVDQCRKTVRRSLTLCHPSDEEQTMAHIRRTKLMIDFHYNELADRAAMHRLEAGFETLANSPLALNFIQTQVDELIPSLLQLTSLVGLFSADYSSGEWLNINISLMRHLALASDSQQVRDLFSKFTHYVITSEIFDYEMQKRSGRGSEEKLELLAEILKVGISKFGLDFMTQTLDDSYSTVYQSHSSWLEDHNSYHFVPILRLLDKLRGTELSSKAMELESNIMATLDSLSSVINPVRYWRPIAMYKPGISYLRDNDWIPGKIISDDMFHLDLSYLKSSAQRYVRAHGPSTVGLINLAAVASSNQWNPQGVFTTKDFKTANRVYINGVNDNHFFELLGQQEDGEIAALDYIRDRLILVDINTAPSKANCLEWDHPNILMNADLDVDLIDFWVPCDYQAQRLSSYEIMMTKPRHFRQCLSPVHADKYNLDPNPNGVDQGIYNCELQQSSEQLSKTILDTIDESNHQLYSQEIQELSVTNLLNFNELSRKQTLDYLDLRSFDDLGFLVLALEALNTDPAGPEFQAKEDFMELYVDILAHEDYRNDRFIFFKDAVQVFLNHFEGLNNTRTSFENKLFLRNSFFQTIINAQRTALEQADASDVINLGKAFRLLRNSTLCQVYGTATFNHAWETFPLSASKRDSVYLPLLLHQGVTNGTGNYRYAYEEARLFANSCWGSSTHTNDDDGLSCSADSKDLDIMFVIDRSGSMGPHADKVKFWTKFLVARLKDKGCYPRVGALTYEAAVDEKRQLPSTDLDEFSKFMDEIEIAGGIEVGLAAVKEALTILNPSDQIGTDHRKFIVLISDELSYNLNPYSADIFPLVNFWIDQRERFKNTYFTHAVIDGSPLQQATQIGSLLNEALSEDHGGRSIHYSLEFPMDFDNFVFDFTNFIIAELNAS